MPKAKQLSVWVDDRPGMLGKVASALGEEGGHHWFHGTACGRPGCDSTGR